MEVVKAHAYGNDFLLVRDEEAGAAFGPDLARALCDRHTGAGADGLIGFSVTARGAAMRLLNADGSRSEVSGNGVRCLAALLVRQGAAGEAMVIETAAGEKSLTLLGVDGVRFTFRAAMGAPEAVRNLDLTVSGEPVKATALRVGNPQCVVLGPLPEEDRFFRLGPALATHAAFPEGTNVEFAEVVSSDRVRILIWERGVGPTRASGTGACAAAVTAILHAGSGRDLTVVSSGGAQRVEWREDGLYLTGWAELTLQGTWLGG
jgi:diaminopimelate epimerase